MKPQDILREKSSLWIFGYGSLVWKPDFAFKGRKIGYINGYKRRFWHGDDFYRGDKEKVSLLRATETFIHVNDFVISQYVEDKTCCSPQPGRVVTLVEEQEVSVPLFLKYSLEYCLYTQHAVVNSLRKGHCNLTQLQLATYNPKKLESVYKYAYVLSLYLSVDWYENLGEQQFFIF